jgi:pyruvate/2-oxoacid:ferredoxin oxidoreductase beta subunit
VNGLEQQKRAVDCATWPLYRFDPRRIAAGSRRWCSIPDRRRSR